MAESDLHCFEWIPGREPPGLQLIKMLATHVQPSQASALMKALGGCLPLGDLSHLKRVNKTVVGVNNATPQLLTVLLCPYTTKDQCLDEAGHQSSSYVSCRAGNEGSHVPAAIIDQQPDAVRQIVTQFELTPFIVAVPRHAPITRQQWSEWKEVWPITWRPPEASVYVPPSQLTSQEEEVAARTLKSTRSLALEATLTTSSAPCNAATIVDPLTGLVVGCGLDSSGRHPLHHAVIVAINAAAKWAATQPEHRDSSISSDEKEQLHCKRARLSEGHAKDSTVLEHSAGVVSVHQPSSSDRQEMETTHQLLDNRPYLCSGYDCYVVHEPCVMCAMALVHSRVRRVFYCRKDTRLGALGGRWRLHGEKSLNHHYDVYYMEL